MNELTKNEKLDDLLLQVQTFVAKEKLRLLTEKKFLIAVSPGLGAAVAKDLSITKVTVIEDVKGLIGTA